MNQLPFWVIPNTNPAFYDSESATAIEQTAKLYGAMRSLISETNAFESITNQKIDSVESAINQKIDSVESATNQKITNLANEFMGKYVENHNAIIETNNRITNLDNRVTPKLEELEAKIPTSSEIISLANTVVQEHVSSVTWTNGKFMLYGEEISKDEMISIYIRGLLSLQLNDGRTLICYDATDRPTYRFKFSSITNGTLVTANYEYDNLIVSEYDIRTGNDIKIYVRDDGMYTFDENYSLIKYPFTQFVSDYNNKKNFTVFRVGDFGYEFSYRISGIKYLEGSLDFNEVHFTAMCVPTMNKYEIIIWSNIENVGEDISVTHETIVNSTNVNTFVKQALVNNDIVLTDDEKLKIEAWLGLSENYLTYYNATPYSVNADYIPAHKKYVDEKSAFPLSECEYLKTTGVVGVITPLFFNVDRTIEIEFSVDNYQHNCCVFGTPKAESGIHLTMYDQKWFAGCGDGVEINFTPFTTDRNTIVINSDNKILFNDVEVGTLNNLTNNQSNIMLGCRRDINSYKGAIKFYGIKIYNSNTGDLVYNFRPYRNGFYDSNNKIFFGGDGLIHPV